MPVRLARLEDIPAIAQVKQAVWSDDTADPDRIATVIQDPAHAIFVALDADQVVGFVDGFATVSSTAVSRWEVDLLAVAPHYQGRGFAKALIQACSAHGQERGAAFARALVQTENTASQRVFAACGYTVSNESYRLFVLADAVDSAPPAAVSHTLHLISVSTLIYQGIWLEGTLSPAGFEFARRYAQDHHLDTAGAVILESASLTISAAQAAGYRLVAHYHWWQRDFKPGAAPTLP